MTSGATAGGRPPCRDPRDTGATVATGTGRFIRPTARSPGSARTPCLVVGRTAKTCSRRVARLRSRIRSCPRGSPTLGRRTRCRRPALSIEPSIVRGPSSVSPARERLRACAVGPSDDPEGDTTTTERPGTDSGSAVSPAPVSVAGGGAGSGCAAAGGSGTRAGGSAGGAAATGGATGAVPTATGGGGAAGGGEGGGGGGSTGLAGSRESGST